MTRGQDTASAILDAAERLMATRGIKAVSLRQILGEAEVNLALGHYHFGSRAQLVAAVLTRPAERLKDEWAQVLSHHEMEAGIRKEARVVLKDLIDPVVSLSLREPEAASLVAQLLASPDPDLQELASSVFRDVFSRFRSVLREALPQGVSDHHLEVGVELMIGTFVFLLTRSNPLGLPGSHDLEPARHKALLTDTVDFCLGGLAMADGVVGEAQVGA